MDKKIIYSGIQPTGIITIGNFIGAISNWLKMQDDYDCIFGIADLHALTVRQVPAEYRKRALSFFAQYIACGLDPEKSILYFQSHVAEHAELQWILNCFTYIGEMQRMTQFKDKAAKHADNINMGLLDYPVLMAADILLYQTSLVPVGIDQKQHLEITRDIAVRFNNLYSPTFTVPEAYIGERGAKIYSLREPGQKMSKSDPNQNGTLYITDSPDVLRKKIMSAVTDSESSVRYSKEKPGISNLMQIMGAMLGCTVESIEAEFAGKGYGDFKKAVADAVIAGLEPVRKRYAEICADKSYVEDVLRAGTECAQRRVNRTMSKVRRKVGYLDLRKK